MAWEIVFPGNPSVMADSLRSVVMLMGYGGENYYLNIVKTGLLFSLLVTLFNGLSLKKGFRLDNLLLHFVVVMAALIPTTSVTVTNYDSRVGDSFVAPQVVDNVPLVMAVPISAATMLGSSLQERLDQVMTPVWVAQNRELFCKKSSGEVSWRTCNFLEAYMESVGRILTPLGGTEVQVNPVWEQNRAAFNRTCDPLNKGPQPNNVMATNVVESWGEFCSDTYITSKQEVIPFIPFNSTVEVGRWGEIKLSNNQPIPQVSCQSACNSIKSEIENNPFILSGCKNEDECKGMKNNFERILRFNELSNKISEQVFMTNLMYICASHDRVGRGPLQSTFEASGSNCKEFASRFLGKLNMAERARETATSRTAFLMTMAAVTFPFIIILVAFGNSMAGKAVTGYAAFMVFLSLVPSIYSASDAIFARQVEQRAELLGVSPVFGSSTSKTMCKSAASSSTCANEVIAFLNDTVNMAENIAEFQSGGVFALAGLIAMIGSLGALVGGGGGGSGMMTAGSSAGPSSAGSSGASGMSGGGSVAGQPMAADIYRGLQMANAATRGGGGFSDPVDFLQSATNFIQGFAAYRSSMPSSVAAQSSMGRAEASFGKEASTSARTSSTASKGSSLNLEAGEMKQIQDAISDIAQRVQNGSITNMSELQNAFAAAYKNMTSNQREALDQIAAKFEANLGGQTALGTRGGGAGGALLTPRAGIDLRAGGGVSQQKGDAVKKNTGVIAENGDSTTATTKVSNQFSEQDQKTIQASLQKMTNEFFKASAGEQGSTQQSGGKDASSSSSESFRGTGSMASPQEMMGGMYALMDEKGKMLSANELKEALQQRMMAAGMSQEQANKFGQAFDQEMGRLKSYGQGVGSTMQAMAAATSAASMLAAKRDPDDAQTGLLASMVMAGQSGAAAQLAASLRDQEQKAKQTEGLAGEWLKWGEGLSAQARDRLMQGAKMAEEVGGEVLARNAQLRNEVASALRDAAKNSTVMDRAAVDKAYQQAVNKVLGTNYTIPETKEALKLAKQMLTDGLKDVGQFIGEGLGNLATGVLTSIGEGLGNLATGVLTSNGARLASVAIGRFAAALGPAGIAYAIADGAVALTTGKGITNRIIDIVAGSPQSGQPASPSGQSQAQPASPQPDRTSGSSPRGVGISGGGFAANFTPTPEELARGNQIAQMVYNDLKGPQKGAAPASNGDFVNQMLKTLGEAPTQSPSGAQGVAPGAESAPGRVSLTQGQAPAATDSPSSPLVQVSGGPSLPQQTNPVTLNQAPTREQPAPVNQEVDKPVDKNIQQPAPNEILKANVVEAPGKDPGAPVQQPAAAVTPAPKVDATSQEMKVNEAPKLNPAQPMSGKPEDQAAQAQQPSSPLNAGGVLGAGKYGSEQPSDSPMRTSPAGGSTPPVEGLTQAREQDQAGARLESRKPDAGVENPQSNQSVSAPVTGSTSVPLNTDQAAASTGNAAMTSTNVSATPNISAQDEAGRGTGGPSMTSPLAGANAEPRNFAEAGVGAGNMGAADPRRPDGANLASFSAAEPGVTSPLAPPGANVQTIAQAGAGTGDVSVNSQSVPAGVVVATPADNAGVGSSSTPSPASPIAPAGAAPFAVASLGDGLAGAGSLPVLGSGLPQGQIAGNTMNTMIVAPERSVGGDAQGQAVVASANSSLGASGVPLSDSGSQVSAIPVDTRGGNNVIV